MTKSIKSIPCFLKSDMSSQNNVLNYLENPFDYNGTINCLYINYDIEDNNNLLNDEDNNNLLHDEDNNSNLLNNNETLTYNEVVEQTNIYPLNSFDAPFYTGHNYIFNDEI